MANGHAIRPPHRGRFFCLWGRARPLLTHMLSTQLKQRGRFVAACAPRNKSTLKRLRTPLPAFGSGVFAFRRVKNGGTNHAKQNLLYLHNKRYSRKGGKLDFVVLSDITMLSSEPNLA